MNSLDDEDRQNSRSKKPRLSRDRIDDNPTRVSASHVPTTTTTTATVNIPNATKNTTTGPDSSVLRVSWAKSTRKVVSKKVLLTVFAPIGDVLKIFVGPNNRFALITMSSPTVAKQAIAALHAKITPQLKSKRIFVEWSKFRNEDERLASEARLVDPTTTDKVHVPGLHVIPNFVTEEEEAFLMKDIDSRQWQETLQRRVQHYGKSITISCPLTERLSLLC